MRGTGSSTPADAASGFSRKDRPRRLSLSRPGHRGADTARGAGALPRAAHHRAEDAGSRAGARHGRRAAGGRCGRPRGPRIVLQPGAARGARTTSRGSATGAAREETRWALYKSWVHWPLGRPAFREFQVPERSGRTTIVTPRFVRHAHRAGLPVKVWTVNAHADIDRLLAWGVDAIISDRPDVAVAAWTQPRDGSVAEALPAARRLRARDAAGDVGKPPVLMQARPFGNFCIDRVSRLARLAAS